MLAQKFVEKASCIHCHTSWKEIRNTKYPSIPSVITICNNVEPFVEVLLKIVAFRGKLQYFRKAQHADEKLDCSQIR